MGEVDDALLDHRKVFIAGDEFGKDGPAVALGFYAVGLLYANKHLTDGFLPAAVVKRFKHADRPLTVAAALVKAGLWEAEADGFRIHDYHDENPWAKTVQDRRKSDRDRKRKNGGVRAR